MIKKVRFTALFWYVKFLRFTRVNKKYHTPMKNSKNTHKFSGKIPPIFKPFFYACILIGLNSKLIAQSSSVFEASYFSKNETDPPLEPGKGFHINDVYKQTRHCFTTESSDESKLKAKGGKKFTLTVHYTENDEQYNLLKTMGVSGKVSYLNLFSLGGSKLESFSSNDYGREERLVFIAKTDFGMYSYPMELALLPEPKALIDQGKHDDFMQMYGTHYICGLRKEASIWVVLNKKDDSYQTSESDQNSVDGGFKTPFKVGVNYRVEDGSTSSYLQNKSEYDVDIILNGLNTDQGDLKKAVLGILDSEAPDKVAAIKELMNSAMTSLSDPSQSVISQYYFAPFTLYGVNNINWDEQKESTLIRINESAIDVMSAQSVVKKLTSPGGLQDVEADFDNDLSTFSKKDQYRAKVEKAFNAALPNLRIYKNQLDTTVTSLQKIYSKCADIHCGAGSGCCEFSAMESAVKALTFKVDNEVSKITRIKDQAWTEAMAEMLAPECQKENIGYLTVINSSSNPYDFYEGDNLIATLKGGSTTKFKVGIGARSFRAKQVSGYLAYPTVNNRNVTIDSACDEETIKVGFED